MVAWDGMKRMGRVQAFRRATGSRSNAQNEYGHDGSRAGKGKTYAVRKDWPFGVEEGIKLQWATFRSNSAND
jgi:hypothetical protein